MKKVKFIIEEVISQEFEIEVDDGFDYDNMSSLDELSDKIKDSYFEGNYVLDDPNISFSSLGIVPEDTRQAIVWQEF